MKVLFINTVFGKGSTGRLIKELGDAIESNQGNYIVAYGRGDISDDEHSYFIGTKLDRYIHVGLSRLTDRAGFYSSNCTKKLVRFIKEYDPNVIHLHNLHGYYLNLPILFEFLANEYKGKIIWTLHDCWPVTGHCVHFTYAKCNKWETKCGKCKEKKEYPQSLLLDQSSRNYEEKRKLFCNIEKMSIVAVSKWLYSIVQNSFLSNYNISYIYNGIDLSKFNNIDSDLREKHNLLDKKVILSVSDGWNERKGFKTILKVAQQAPEDWIFIVIGLEKRQLKHLGKNVIGVEHIWNPNELIQYYSMADAFFNPSIEETFGLVTAEAIACGTPVIVMNSTACPELVDSGTNGYVIEANATVDDIIKTINSTFSLKGCHLDKNLFEMTKFKKQYMELYFEK